jgi:hypothetical protein
MDYEAKIQTIEELGEKLKTQAYMLRSRLGGERYDSVPLIFVESWIEIKEQVINEAIQSIEEDLI